MAGLESAEAALGLAPPALARLLTQALAMEGGTLAPAGEPGAYRVQAPPAWKALVDETLRIRKGDLQGALPKVTFDAVALEVVEEGRRVFRPRPDTVLLRLGHPVMRRALGMLRRRMWDDGSGGLSRWTVLEDGLPDGVTTLLLVHVLLTATNPLREVAHAEVLPLAFDARGAGLVALDSTKVPLREGRPVAEGRLATLLPDLRASWLDHREGVEEALAGLRQERTGTLEKELASLLKEEMARERENFAARKKELRIRRLPKAIERLRQEAEQTEQRLVQSPLLFREMQEEEERRLREIQWEVHRAQQDQLLSYLEREEERVLTKVLPRRFALARLDVQPVAVEYRVSGKGVG